VGDIEKLHAELDRQREELEREREEHRGSGG
jgi:hypothetical protein